MRSVTIRDRETNEILIKVLHRTNGQIENLTHIKMSGQLKIQIRDDQNCLTTYYPEIKQKAGKNRTRIKIDEADEVFSQYIRYRDKKCVRCGSPVQFNGVKPVSHQASHYFGRSKESVRFDPENVDTLCFGCHRIWGSDDKEGYRQFKIKQLGLAGFNQLQVRSNRYKKKDRKMALIIAKELLSEARGGIG